MASLYLPKYFQLSDDSGDPLNGGKLYFYVTTTTTPKSTYPTEADAIAGTNANVNPVVLDADGRSPVEIWISGRYRLITKTSALVTISDDDPVEDVTPGSGGQTGALLYGGNNSGTANALAFAYAPTLTVYTNGQVLRGRITADNSTAVTINADSLGVKSLVKQDGTALIAGDLQGPGILEFAYDSATNVFRLLSPDGHLFRDGNNAPARVDVASVAGTVNLDTAASNYVRITGALGITAFTLTDGRYRNVVAGGAFTVTTGASLVVTGYSSGTVITFASGDTFDIRGESAGVVRITNLVLAVGGQRLLAASSNLATPADTTEDTLATITIPANAMGANGMVRVTTDWTYNNPANTKTGRIRFSGGSGTVLIGHQPAAGTGMALYTSFANKAVTNSQVNTGYAFDAAAATLTPSAFARTSAVDTTAATTIVITGQKNTAGDNLTLNHYTVELLPSA